MQHLGMRDLCKGVWEGDPRLAQGACSAEPLRIRVGEDHNKAWFYGTRIKI